ncbi:uncharacterized protein EKO05_0004447 [Ascochyta rabiei]|uniref:Uncharacterized protein n=1 Tax=Didymella rabiei TaxID=5454 RepID=A0A163DN09_DIDRA|nr:uncharacterized protein EKO05_0004447 [Ascochyta rabiei]KZM23267.1 hypothetical protein ST47_g5597 [Ascochyta rabiei]UPX13953.1 hypothetical protein EKO05_0004447 [Ascochyta rabiei]
MDPPIICVEDHTTTPTLTLRYVCGTNDLDLKAICADIYRLGEHPGQARLNPNSIGCELVPCRRSFLDVFWSAAASLLDYFADFFAADSALMQSIWFQLLDTWQSACPLRLYQEVTTHRHTAGPADVAAARSFLQDYKNTIKLMHTVMSTKTGARPDDHGVSTIHCPSGAVDGLAARYNTGPYVSGLKPWQQFLCNGGPGFQPSTTADSNNKNDIHSVETEKGTTTHYVPQPAIGLIQAHTARARHLASKLAAAAAAAAVKEEAKEEAKGEAKGEAMDTAQLLAHFDATALRFPSSTSGSYTQGSLLQGGTRVGYQLQRGAPPVQRHEGVGDASMLVARPDVVLLDEAVGSCRGRDAYVPMTGPIGVAGVGFDVWCVTEGRSVMGWMGGGQDGEGSVLVGGVGELFDDWHFEEEDTS